MVSIVFLSNRGTSRSPVELQHDAAEVRQVLFSGVLLLGDRLDGDAGDRDALRGAEPAGHGRPAEHGLADLACLDVEVVDLCPLQGDRQLDSQRPRPDDHDLGVHHGGGL